MIPPTQSYTLRNCKIICRVVLIGTYATTGITSALLIMSWVLQHSPQAPWRLTICCTALIYIGFTHWLIHKHRYHTAAYMLVFFYTCLATGILWSWGINTPIGLLLFGMVIVLAGILLTARHALVAALVAFCILIALQTASSLGWHHPNTTWTSGASRYGDALGYGTVFGMLALLSWLYNREMEQSLAQAERAQEALLQQKATLKLQVKKRTDELRRAQLKEMQQLYRFSELGQLGVTLLHDLANHLTALNLEIEGLRNKQQSVDMARAREITQYLEGIVENTRERLHGGTQKQTFNIIQKMNETIAFLRYKAAKAGVVIDWQPPAQNWRYTGDPTYLSQVLAILTNNAIDAYADAQSGERRVYITIERNSSLVIITIEDWGKGVSKHNRRHLFKPFHGTKKSGLGLGLFIAKQTVETNFAGTLTLNQHSDHTEFMIKLPREHG